MSELVDHELGIVGLATMGMNLARNLGSHGIRVAVYNRTRQRTDEFMASHGGEGDFHPAVTLEELVHTLTPPRAILLMVKAGAPVDEGIEALQNLVGGPLIGCFRGVRSGHAHTRRVLAELFANDDAWCCTTLSPAIELDGIEWRDELQLAGE